MSLLRTTLITPLKERIESSGLKWFDDILPYQLNIVGIRTPNREAGKYDDYLIVAYRDELLQWVVHQWPVTTDSGFFYLNNPLTPRGTAILKAGQYIDCYKIGLHRGRYSALVQCAPVKVYRDNNKDRVLDFMPESIQEGIFGINIHRSSLSRFPDEVGRWSAGCTVFRFAKHFNDFMSVVHKSNKKGFNRFTYSLIEE